MVQLRDVIADLENGWSPKCHSRPTENGEWGVLKVSAGSSGEYRELENKALPATLQPKPNIEVKAGDILIMRASGVARLVGVPVYVEKTREQLMICDKIFRVVSADTAKIAPWFLANVLRIHHVRSQIEREFSTESGMMKNVSKPVLLSLNFPLPPIEDQIALTDTLVAARTMAADLREQAKATRSIAWTDFETAVYATTTGSKVDRGIPIP